MGCSPAVGEEGEHGQQQQDEHEDEGERQDERVQVWRARNRSRQWACPKLSPNPSYTPTWGLTTSCQQRRRLRPSTPEAVEARLRHARAHREGVARSAPQVAQHALRAAVQDLHLAARTDTGR